MSHGRSMTYVAGGDRPVPTAPVVYDPRPKPTGLDWDAISKASKAIAATGISATAIGQGLARDISDASARFDAFTVQYANRSRPECCPWCKEIICDRDCSLAFAVGWPTETTRVDNGQRIITKYIRPDPTQSRKPPMTDLPAYAQDAARLLAQTETTPDPRIRALRKTVVAAFLELWHETHGKAWPAAAMPAPPAPAPLRQRTPFTDDDIDDMVLRYARGQSAGVIAKQYGVTPKTILARLRERGVTIRDRNDRSVR